MFSFTIELKYVNYASKISLRERRNKEKTAFSE